MVQEEGAGAAVAAAPVRSGEDLQAEIRAHARELATKSIPGGDDDVHHETLILDFARRRLLSVLSQDPASWASERSLLQTEMTWAMQEMHREKEATLKMQKVLLDAQDRHAAAVGRAPRVPPWWLLVLVGATIALMLMFVMAPTVEAFAFIDEQSGLPVPYAGLKALGVSLALGGCIVFPSLYAAHFPGQGFIVRHGTLLFGALVAVGIAVMRAQAVGGWTLAVTGLTLLELGIVVLIEVFAAILRQRQASQVDVIAAAADLRNAERQEAAAQAALDADRRTYETEREEYLQLDRWMHLLEEMKDTDRREAWLEHAAREAAVEYEVAQRRLKGTDNIAFGTGWKPEAHP